MLVINRIASRLAAVIAQAGVKGMRPHGGHSLGLVIDASAPLDRGGDGTCVERAGYVDGTRRYHRRWDVEVRDICLLLGTFRSLVPTNKSIPSRSLPRISCKNQVQGTPRFDCEKNGSPPIRGRVKNKYWRLEEWNEQ